MNKELASVDQRYQREDCPKLVRSWFEDFKTQAKRVVDARGTHQGGL